MNELTPSQILDSYNKHNQGQGVESFVSISPEISPRHKQPFLSVTIHELGIILYLAPDTSEGGWWEARPTGGKKE